MVKSSSSFSSSSFSSLITDTSHMPPERKNSNSTSPPSATVLTPAPRSKVPPAVPPRSLESKLTAHLAAQKDNYNYALALVESSLSNSNRLTGNKHKDNSSYNCKHNQNNYNYMKEAPVVTSALGHLQHHSSPTLSPSASSPPLTYQSAIKSPSSLSSPLHGDNDNDEKENEVNTTSNTNRGSKSLEGEETMALTHTQHSQYDDVSTCDDEEEETNELNSGNINQLPFTCHQNSQWNNKCNTNCTTSQLTLEQEQEQQEKLLQQLILETSSPSSPRKFRNFNSGQRKDDTQCQSPHQLHSPFNSQNDADEVESNKYDSLGEDESDGEINNDSNSSRHFILHQKESEDECKLRKMQRVDENGSILRNGNKFKISLHYPGHSSPANEQLPMQVKLTDGQVAASTPKLYQKHRHIGNRRIGSSHVLQPIYKSSACSTSKSNKIVIDVPGSTAHYMNTSPPAASVGHTCPSTSGSVSSSSSTVSSTSSSSSGYQGNAFDPYDCSSGSGHEEHIYEELYHLDDGNGPTSDALITPPNDANCRSSTGSDLSGNSTNSNGNSNTISNINSNGSGNSNSQSITPSASTLPGHDSCQMNQFTSSGRAHALAPNLGGEVPVHQPRQCSPLHHDTSLSANNSVKRSPRALNSQAYANQVIKSMFDGASKDEILEYLEDAKERVKILATSSPIASSSVSSTLHLAPFTGSFDRGFYSESVSEEYLDSMATLNVHPGLLSAVSAANLSSVAHSCTMSSTSSSNSASSSSGNSSNSSPYARTKSTPCIASAVSASLSPQSSPLIAHSSSGSSITQETPVTPKIGSIRGASIVKNSAAQVTAPPRRNRSSNVSNSSTDSAVTTGSSSCEQEAENNIIHPQASMILTPPSQFGSSSVDATSSPLLPHHLARSISLSHLIERTDSGVGAETSKPCRLRRALSGESNAHPFRCIDCDEICPEQVLTIDDLDVGLCVKCEKKRTERKEIISEFVDTEFKYGRDLRIIKEEFYRPIEVAGLMTKDQLKAVFINLEELISVNVRFAHLLEDSLDAAYESGDEVRNKACNWHLV